jgi:hypothetical protein
MAEVSIPFPIKHYCCSLSSADFLDQQIRSVANPLVSFSDRRNFS